MKNLGKQNDKGACGVYNLANVLRNKDIIDRYAEDEAFLPCGIPQMNKILSKENYDMRMKGLIGGVNWERRIPRGFGPAVMRDLIEVGSDQNVESVVFIMVVQADTRLDDRGLHAVSLVRKPNGEFWFSDPSEDEFVAVAGPGYVWDKYEWVNQILTFGDFEGNYISIKNGLYGNDISSL